MASSVELGEEETPARVYLFVDSVIIHSSCRDTKYLDNIAPAAEVHLC